MKLGLQISDRPAARKSPGSNISRDLVTYMPSINTKQFGILQFSEEEIFEFPDGIPGFDTERSFLYVERPALRPVVFLQSVGNPDLCFVTLPALSIDPDYELQIAPEELNILGVAGCNSNAQESSLACLAIVCLPPEGQPTANLLGPVILSRKTKKGLQSVRDDCRYSATTPIASASATTESAGDEQAPAGRLAEV